MSNSNYILSPPDGGFGWIIVINVFDRSMISVFSLVFGPFFKAIELSKKNVALVMNLTNLFLNFTGLFVGALIKAFSPRTIAVCASLSISLGLIITSFTSTIYEIIFSYCFLVGTGLGCITNSYMVVVTSYFTTKKARAVSFSMAGSGFGKMLMPQTVTLLVIFYDHRGVILIIGALALNGLVGALLLHPVEWHMKKKIDDVSDDDDTAPLLMKSRKNLKIEAPNEEVRMDSFWQRIAKQLDLNLLKDSRFIILNICLATDYAVAVDFTLIFPFFLEVKNVN
jgi:MFS family permease